MSPQSRSPAPPNEVFQQIGLITRQLHDTLEQLGVMPKLQRAADGLPDARSRLQLHRHEKRCGSREGAELRRPREGRTPAHGGGNARHRRGGISADPLRAADSALLDLVCSVDEAGAASTAI